MQGVGNFYTDPQIHSFDGCGFGAGNLGQVRARMICNIILFYNFIFEFNA